MSKSKKLKDSAAIEPAAEPIEEEARRPKYTVYRPDDENEKIREVIQSVQYIVGKCTKYYPFFGSILYHHRIVFTDAIPTAGTDTRNLFINPLFFADMDEKKQRFVIFHEVLHNTLSHFTRVGSRDPRLWNIAADYELNQILVDENLPDVASMSDMQSVGILYDEKYKGMCAEEIYDDVIKNAVKIKVCAKCNGNGSDDSDESGDGSEDKSGKSGKPCKCGGKGSSMDGDIMTPKEGRELEKELGIEPSTGSDDPNQIQNDWNVKLREASMLPTKRNGEGFGSSLRDAIAKRLHCQVDWRAELRRFIGTAASAYSHVFPARRFVHTDSYRYTARPKINKLNDVVLAIDVSGSISDRDLNTFMVESYAIIDKIKPDNMHMVFWDHGVHEHYVVRSQQELKKVRPTGGGGTVFQPVQDWVSDKDNFNRKEPNAVIILTDGYFDTNLKPPKWAKNALWIIIENPLFEAPYGAKVLHIKTKDISD